MNLDELARLTAADDETTFRTRYPAPALVFLATQATPGSEPKIDTPTRGTDLDQAFRATGVLEAGAYPILARQGLLSETHRDELASHVAQVTGNFSVVFLGKSGRNPFNNMVTVGRAPNNDVPVPLRTVSKLHASFTHSPSGWKITDHGSTNGTLVDEQRLPSSGSVLVADSTRIGFGPEARANFHTPEGLFAFLALYRAGVVG